LAQSLSSNIDQQTLALSSRAAASHALGDIATARTDFANAEKLSREPLYSLRGLQLAQHRFNLGALVFARSRAEHCLRTSGAEGWRDEHGWAHALLARIDLRQGKDPTPHIEEIRSWTARTGDVAGIVTAHLLGAQFLLARADMQAAMDESETGLLHARACDYRLLIIELLVAQARIRLAWPDPRGAIQTAHEAVEAAANCSFAWGEADAAQVLGEAYVANGEEILASHAFRRALKVRKRIEHPDAEVTAKWLYRDRRLD